MQGVYGPSGLTEKGAEIETVSMTVARRLGELSDMLNRIEQSVVMVCGGQPGDPKQTGPVPVPSGLHAQWAETLEGLCFRAERAANILSNV